jgi:hypothetical protein
LDKLITITEEWHDQDLVMIDARRLLASHRLNYTSQGAQCLEILWWECPPEQWESLRFVGSMNVIETPVPVLEENGKMNEGQLTIAVAFMTELITPWCPTYECVAPFSWSPNQENQTSGYALQT